MSDHTNASTGRRGPSAAADRRSHANRAVLRFWRKLATFWAPVLLVLGAMESVLWRVGETLPIDRVIERQAAEPDAMFLRRFVGQDFFAYKVKNALRRRAEILATGSSRVMSFRREMFGADAPRFYNAGGAVQSIPDLQTFARMLPPSAMPKVMIVGIDMWWLNPSWRAQDGLAAARDSASSWKSHLAALRAILLDHREFGIFVETASTPMPDRYIGVGARHRRAGFREDGSMNFGLSRPPAGAGGFVDREDPPVLERIRRGIARFEFANNLSEQRLAALVSTLDEFQRRGVVVVAFLPPVWSEAAQTLSTDRRHAGLWGAYRIRVPQALEAAGVPVLDASTPSMLGATDAWMIDGFHADERFHEVLTRRILDIPEVRGALR